MASFLSWFRETPLNLPNGKKWPTNNSWQLIQVKNYLFKPENNYLGNFCGSDSSCGWVLRLSVGIPPHRASGNLPIQVRAARLQNETAPENVWIRYAKRFENRDKDTENHPKRVRKVFSPSSAANKLFTGTFLKVFHRSKFAQIDYFFTSWISRGGHANI